MVIQIGEKVHVIYRALYDNSTRRHMLGEVTAAEGAICRIDGFMFVYDSKAATYNKRQDKRMTVIDLAESGFLVSILPSFVNLEQVRYEYLEGIGLAATDGDRFVLDIHEFGTRY